MPGNPNPSFNLTVDLQGLAPAPAGGGNVPLVIGWTQQGEFSGYPGVGLYSFSNLNALVAALGNYGNAVDAAALDLAVGASEVLVYKAFAGSVGSGNWTHTGSGTGTIAVSGNLPLAPYGAPTSTGSTGIIIQVTTSSNGSIFGDFNYSLDNGVSFSTPQPIVPSTPQVLGNTGVSVVFTGADSSGVWVANDTYVKAITTATGQMWPYGASSFSILQTTATGSTTVVGEGTFTAGGSANPLDSFQVIVQITKTGTVAAGNAQYVFSLDGGNTFSPNNTIPTSGDISLAGGVTLTPADTGGPGGTQAGFVQGELYRFGTLGPQLTPANVLAIIESLQGNPNTWGWIHVSQECNTVNTAATTGFELNTIFADMETAISTLFNAGQYVGGWGLIDTPPDNATTNIDSLLETWAAGVSGQYTTVGVGGSANIVSPANGWQLRRGSAFAVSARACVAPIGQDLAWVGAGALVGVADLLRNEANTPGLGPAGFAPLLTIAGVPGFYIANANLLVAANNDISLAQYRRVINAACQAARTALTQFLSGSVRLTPTGKIDPRDVANIQNVTLQAVQQAINGQASGANVAVSNTLGSGGVLSVTISVTPLGYAKAINVTIGFVNPSLSAQAA